MKVQDEYFQLSTENKGFHISEMVNYILLDMDCQVFSILLNVNESMKSQKGLF